MEYYWMKNDKDKYVTLIGSLVNTGNIRQIYEKHLDETIPSNYDCNHVHVFATNGEYGNMIVTK